MTNEHTKKYAWAGAVVAALLLIGGLLYGRLSDRANKAPLEVLLQDVPYEVVVTGETFTPAVGQTAAIEFAVTLNGQPIDLAADTIYPHAYVVSEDLHDVWFYHIDSLEQIETGVYQFSHRFTQAASYTVWIEFNDNKTRDHHGGQSDYIARFTVDPQGAPGDSMLAAPTNVTAAQSYLPGTEYQLRLLPYELKAGEPGTVTIVAEDLKGGRVALLPEFDHFFALASSGTDFYVLDHPHSTQTGDTEAVLGPFTFPRAGRYALWIRLFPDDGTGEVTDAIEGVLILEVK